MNGSSQTLKPSSPTSPDRKRYNLSSMDQFSSPQYVPLVFHYPNSSSVHDTVDKSSHLKSSLSETLIEYYPFAGRVSSCGSYIDCNDEGIEFQEVSFEFGILEVLEKPEHEVREFFYPKEKQFVPTKDSTLLVVRVNYFKCGGISILVCLSHKVSDATGFITFMITWAMKTQKSMKYDPGLNDSSEFSPHFFNNERSSDNEDAVRIPELPPMDSTPWVIRRFVFPNSKLAELKTAASHTGSVENISRVDVLTALIFKAATAANAAKLGFFSPTVLFQTMNMRQKMLTPLPKSSIGNIYWSNIVPNENESENNLETLVKNIKKGKAESNGMKTLDANMYVSKVVESLGNNRMPLACTSLCRMQFDQVDFGWGSPVRVSVGNMAHTNAIALTDTPSRDGIEALVALDEDTMNAFQEDPDILAFSLPF